MSIVCCPHNDARPAVCNNANVAEEERNYLQAWRLKAKLTQEDLAEAIGTTKAVISLLESEKRPLSSKWLRKIAPVLGTRPGWLLDYHPDDIGDDMIDAWADVPSRFRPQVLEIIRTFAEPKPKTGTDS